MLEIARLERLNESELDSLKFKEKKLTSELSDYLKNVKELHNNPTDTDKDTKIDLETKIQNLQIKKVDLVRQITEHNLIVKSLKEQYLKSQAEKVGFFKQLK